MSVQFRDAFVADMAPATTLEDAWRKLAAFGGIHRIVTDKLVDVQDFSSAEWDTSDGSWTVSARLVGDDDGTGGWHVAWYTGNANDNYRGKETPTSFVIETLLFDTSDNNVIVVRGDGASNFYAVHITPSAVAFYKVTGGTWNKLSDIAYTAPDKFSTPAVARLAVSQQKLSDNNIDKWLFLSLWLDDMFVLSARDNIADSTPGLRWGLGYENSSSTTTTVFDYVVIPDLSELMAFVDIQPGETPTQAIRRVVADRVIRSFVRYDGSLRVKRTGASDVMRTFTASDQYGFSVTKDDREISNHVRLYYSRNSVEVFDDATINNKGHRFIEVSNSYIEDDNIALSEAKKILKRIKADSRSASFITKRGGFLIEPEDRISLPDGSDWVVNSVSVRWDSGSIETTLRCRGYTYG